MSRLLSPRVALALAGSMAFAGVSAQGDEVIPDDLIVQGSVAVGTDSVNGENFGFNTLVLKESDLRIHFQDTSTPGSFASNDWRILINDLDAAVDPESYFAIEDTDAGTVPFRIDAGAATDSLRLGGNGRVGLLTGAPAASLHVNVTHDAMDVTKSVIIGPETLTPSGALLQVHGPVYLSKDGGADLTLDPNSDTRLYVEGGALFSRNIEVGSSRELKEDIRELGLAEARDALMGLKAVEYRYIGDPERQLGFIAEEVPDLVATDSRKSLSPMDFVAVLTRVVQDQDERMKAQDSEVETLRESLESLLREVSGETPGNRAETTQP